MFCAPASLPESSRVSNLVIAGDTVEAAFVRSTPIRKPLAACVAIVLSAAVAPAIAGSGVADALQRTQHLAERMQGDGAARLDAWRRHRAAFEFLPSPPREPATQTVGNCNDSGSGSLRNAIAAAAEGDTIDMSQLSCSTITLTSGALPIHANDLTIVGRGQQSLTVDAGRRSGIFEHYGNGTLAISDLALANGYYGLGGCVSSVGSVSLMRVTVTGCTATGYAGTHSSIGGGVLAIGNVTLTSSVISNNNAYDSAFSGDIVYGGGVFAGGVVTVTGSTFSANTATASGNYAAGGAIATIGGLVMSTTTVHNNTAIEVLGNYGVGGGLFTGGDVLVVASTFDTNNASIGAALSVGTATGAVAIVDSTIAGNQAALAGGIAVVPALTLDNSTVAFNYSGGPEGGAGIVLSANSTFQSSIVANNNAVGSTSGADVAGAQGAAFVIGGANNLVMHAASGISLPSGTLHSDPMLAAFLENNGGPTQTLALNAASPAIDAGNNAAGLALDQRGFARVSGSAADIGAYELQGSQGDEIFAGDFDG